MLDEVRALLILQNRDRRLLAIHAELTKLPTEEARANAKLKGDTVAVAAAHDALRSSELEVKKIELDVQTRRLTIERLNKQQFETRKNDEYQAIGHEVTRYEKDVDALETRILEAMEVVDTRRAALHKAEAALKETQKLIAAELAELHERLEHLKTEKKEVDDERSKLAEDVPEDILPLYERLMKSKDGLAVAPMEDGRCEGCHMKLIASTVVKVNSEVEMTQCEDCGRILYAE